jgi:uncharacterized YccA/Bax inhibitor family protein
MVASGLVTLIGTPLLLLKAGPVAAVYPYLWGWVLATALTIAFALKDGLWLDYGDAFGRPMVPSAAMVASYGLAKALGLGPLGSLLLALAVLATVTGAIEIEQRGRWGARHIQRLKRHVPFHPPWA